jgi:hypothetical protein
MLQARRVTRVALVLRAVPSVPSSSRCMSGFGAAVLEGFRVRG